LENNLFRETIIDPHGFIYITTNMINGKKYIGQKVFDTNSMWKSYLGSGTYLKNAINKYGKENFYREIVAIAYSQEDLNRFEIELIKNHNAVKSKDYYNISYGGESVMFGRKHTDKTKQQMSRSFKGRVYSEEHNIKISKSKLESNFKYSKESKQKMSDSHIGKKLPKEQKEKISAKTTGEKNPATKLTNKIVIEIKKMLQQGFTTKEITSKYNISPQVLSQIRTEKHWKSVTIPNI